jgi:hypothetical protein
MIIGALWPAREARLAAADTPSDASPGIGGQDGASRREMEDGDTSTQCQGTCSILRAGLSEEGFVATLS